MFEPDVTTIQVVYMYLGIFAFLFGMVFVVMNSKS